MAEPLDGLVGNQRGDRKEGAGIDDRGEDLGPSEAVRVEPVLIRSGATGECECFMARNKSVTCAQALKKKLDEIGRMATELPVS